jgi:LAO/AO transport system kinase
MNAADQTQVSGQPHISDEGAGAALADLVVKRDRRAAARLISLIENDAPGVEEQLRRIISHTGRAHVVGITGPTGGGKSVLVGKLAKEFRARGRGVGVIAVDPTSPFTGGAVLGDRVRMQDLTSDRGVFIRSMASRGALGGIAAATADAANVLDAYGCDIILVETVGAGQDEVDIVRMAHTIVVVQVPGMGDEIQAIKAGILEIGDVFAVNKADKSRADVAVSDLRMMLETGTHSSAWMPPVVKTVATKGEGVAELARAVEQHMEHLRRSGELARRMELRARRELLEATKRLFLEQLSVGHPGRLEEMARHVAERRLDARSAARELVNEFRGLRLPPEEGRDEGGGTAQEA